MEKKLNDWCKLKQEIISKSKVLFLKNRQVLWVSVGKNIGDEENGKGKMSSRPVLVLKVLSKTSFIGIPLSLQFHEGSFFYNFEFIDTEKNITKSTALLNQIRIFSNNRVYAPSGERISKENFIKIKKKLGKLLGIFAPN